VLQTNRAFVSRDSGSLLCTETMIASVVFTSAQREYLMIMN
jgi:hypothetical protein